MGAPCEDSGTFTVTSCGLAVSPKVAPSKGRGSVCCEVKLVFASLRQIPHVTFDSQMCRVRVFQSGSSPSDRLYSHIKTKRGA